MHLEEQLQALTTAIGTLTDTVSGLTQQLAAFMQAQPPESGARAPSKGRGKQAVVVNAQPEVAENAGSSGSAPSSDVSPAEVPATAEAAATDPTPGPDSAPSPWSAEQAEEVPAPAPVQAVELVPPAPVVAAGIILPDDESKARDQVRAVAIDFAAEFGKAEFVKLCQGFGIVGIPTLPPERYMEFLIKMADRRNELGAA